MRKLLVDPSSISEGASRLPLVTDPNGSGGLFLHLNVNLSSFPDGADRDDALHCGYLEVSPYWDEPYKLIVDDSKTVQYVPTCQDD